jgi:serine protease Do
VLAFGSPFGYFQFSVTRGIVSAVNRPNPYSDNARKPGGFIQTDAAINPGNSGGALINAQGRLIGINTMILTGGGATFGEAGNIGIGFAVPSNLAKQVMDQLQKTGKVSRGYLGATLQSLTGDLAPQFGLKEPKGALITKVEPNGPGDKAGLKMGDVIVAIDGKPVTGSDDATLAIISHAPGSSVKLDIMHDGKPKSLTVTLGERPTGLDWGSGRNQSGDDGDDNDSDNGSGTTATMRGISVQNLTPQIAEQVGVPANTQGVVVTSVDPSSPAADALGDGQGIVIMAVDRKPIHNVSEFRRYMSEAKGKPVLLTINAGGQTGFTVVQPQ